MPDRPTDIEPGTESDERENVDRAQRDEIVIRAGANSLGKQDHYHSVLARMVSSVSQDPEQLRGLVYEFARRKLRKDLVREFEDGDFSEIEHQIATLEGAIDQLETDLSDGDVPRLPYSGNGESKNRPSLSVVTAEPLPPLSQQRFFAGSFGGSAGYNYNRQPRIVNVTDYAAKTCVERHLRSHFWRTIELIVAVTIGVAIYSALDRQTALNFYNSVRYGRSASTATASLPQSAPNASPDRDIARSETPPSRPGVSGIPLPASYGVYALSDGKLTPLDQLPIKPPDPRISISAAINTPSQAHLDAGPIQFVVYRRDFANDAPDRVSVRVVAQVMRALTFDANGKASYVKVEPTWVVRSQTYQMSVAPAANSSEMLVIRPDTEDFTFAPGRYALVLKKDAYDFTIDGPVNDTAHCLERTDALGGAVYSECPKPTTNSPAPPARSTSKASDKK